MIKRKRRRKKYPIIYIKTNRNGWTKVKLIKRKPNNVIYCGTTDRFHEESASLQKNPVNTMFVGPNVSLFKSTWAEKYEEDLDRYLKDPNYNVYKE